MDRRLFLAAGVALAGCAAVNRRALKTSSNKTPEVSAWRIPAEFEPTRAVWMGYSDDPEFSAVSVRMAQALSPYTDLVVVAEDEKGLSHARTALSSAGMDQSRISFLHNEASRFFIRDYNVFATGPDGLGVVDFGFESYGLPGWCSDHLYPDAPERAKRCAGFVDPVAGKLEPWIAARKQARLFSSQLFLEGGAIEVNGCGTLLVSEALMRQRNRGLSMEAMNKQLLNLPGVRKVVWLGEGVAEDPHMKGTIVSDYIGFGAGSHTDEFVRFVDPRTVLIAWVEPTSANLHAVEKITAARMQRNFEILSAATDQDGRHFRIIKVPMPKIISRPVVLQEKSTDWSTWTAGVFPAAENRKVGDQLTHVAASSYLNYVVANGIVLLPDYTNHGTSVRAQGRVEKIFRTAFPRRAIKFVDVTNLNWAGGGIHCATCNEPAVL